MLRKRFKLEEIIHNLREVEILLSQGQTVTHCFWHSKRNKLSRYIGVGFSPSWFFLLRVCSAMQRVH